MGLSVRAVGWAVDGRATLGHHSYRIVHAPERHIRTSIPKEEEQKKRKCTFYSHVHIPLLLVSFTRCIVTLTFFLYHFLSLSKLPSSYKRSFQASHSLSLYSLLFLHPSFSGWQCLYCVKHFLALDLQMVRFCTIPFWADVLLA